MRAVVFRAEFQQRESARHMHYPNNSADPGAAMQTDDNLVTFSDAAGSGGTRPVWNSATYLGGANAFLEITDNQSLLLYSAGNQLLWGEPPQSLTPWQGWRLSHFAGPQLVNDAVSGPLAQPAGDGYCNLLKYATSLAPLTPANGAAYPMLGGGTSAGTLAFTYTRDTAATDVNARVEQSADLLTWIPVSGTPSVLSATGTVQTLRLPITTNSPRIFLRLTVSAP